MELQVLSGKILDIQCSILVPQIKKAPALPLFSLKMASSLLL